MTEQEREQAEWLVIEAQENIWQKSGRRGYDLLHELGYDNNQIVHSAIGYLEDFNGGTFILPYIEDGQLTRVDKITFEHIHIHMKLATLG